MLTALVCSSAFSTGQPPPDNAGQAPIQNPKSKIQNPIHFTDVTAQSGIDMIMTCGGTPSTEILEVNGGGLALIDFDNDGDLDLFVANGATLIDPEHGPGCRLYRNDGNLKFSDITAQSGINLHRWAMGAAVGDYDGDGLDDIYVACFGPNVLLRNLGGGRFEDATARAGVGDSRWGTSAAFGDIDNDGDLDLYVCNYLEFDPRHPPPHAKYKGVEVMAGPHGMKAQHDVLYENFGDGTFRDITAASGCLPPNPAFGLNVVILDFDRDGRQDIVVSNDSMPDFYFHNIGLVDGRPKFEEIGVLSGIAANADGGNQASMGIAIADVDGNGFPDKFITVFSSDTNALHMNMDGRFFEDRSQQYGLAMISRPYLGWSCGFFDFDLDGDEDLFMVNGHVYPQATLETMDSDYAQTPLLFERAGKRFNRVLPEAAGAWLAEKHRDRNAVFADLDDDGDIDIIIGELNGPIRVLLNDCRNGIDDLRSTIDDSKQSPDLNRQSSWLIVELRDDRPTPGNKNHRGLGSRIELTSRDANGNDIKQTRWLFTGGGFQSSGTPYAHFGLASASSALAMTVTWPDGIQQPVSDVTPGQHLVVKRARP